MATAVGQQAEEIVDAILRDMNQRSGFRMMWHSIDESLRAEIRSDWMLIARRVIERR